MLPKIPIDQNGSSARREVVFATEAYDQIRRSAGKVRVTKSIGLFSSVGLRGVA